jgi:small subunit ribosomal protein S6
LYIENFNCIKLHPLPINGGFFDKFELTKENMSCYEHTFIVKADTSEEQGKKTLNKYEDIIKKNSGKIIKIEEWGLKNFSYVIKNNKKGFYYHIKFEGIGNTVQELERAENIDQSLIRFLTVKVKEHDLKNEYLKK